MNSKNDFKPRELDGPAAVASKPRAVVQITQVTLWQPLRGGVATADDCAEDALLGTTNIGGYLREKLCGDNFAATTAPALHKRKPSRKKRNPVTCAQALEMAEGKRKKYLTMANEQAAKPYYDANATLSSSDVSRLFSDMAKMLADLIENIIDVDPALLAKAAKQMRSKQRKGYGVLQKIAKNRGAVLPTHATGYIPGEPFRSSVKAYRALSYIAAKAVKLLRKLRDASEKHVA